MIKIKDILWLVYTPALVFALDNSAARAQSESASQSAQPTRAEIARALARYANEPTIAQVVRAVLRSAADPKSAENLAARARAAGWVPVVKVAARRGIGAGLSASQTLETDRTSLSTDDDLVLEASLTFQFDRLVFDSDEVAIARDKRAIEQSRQELVQASIALYFERRKLQLQRDLSGRAEPQNELRIAKIEALLNAFTNGEFGRNIPARDRSTR